MTVSTSQNSYVTKATRFKNAVTLLNGWADYLPNNDKIKKVNLLALSSSMEAANDDVTAKEEIIKTLRRSRLLLNFTVREGPKDERGTRAIINKDCLEECLIGIRNYLAGEELSEATLKIIERIISKVRPQYSKKAEGAKEAPSPSEKSFAAMTGYLRQVIKLITNLGADYNPPDAKLSVAGMTTLLTDIEQNAEDIQTALEAYGKSNRARKKLFGPLGGYSDVNPKIKSYLASFEDKKKSEHYIEYNDAIKGV